METIYASCGTIGMNYVHSNATSCFSATSNPCCLFGASIQKEFLKVTPVMHKGSVDLLRFKQQYVRFLTSDQEQLPERTIHSSYLTSLHLAYPLTK